MNADDITQELEEAGNDLDPLKSLLADATKARDTWEPDLDEPEHKRIYDEMLNDVHGTVTVAGQSFLTSEALKALDETAYREAFNDWTSMDQEEMANIFPDLRALCAAVDEVAEKVEEIESRGEG